MAEIYPRSMLCRFEGFPARIRVVCGRAFSETRGTPLSFGSRVTLVRTPKSGVVSGALVPGEALPVCELVYADSGDDDRFDLKVSHYGYGRFYLPQTGASRYALAIVKGIRVEAAGINRSFETVDNWETLIPASVDLSRPAAVPDAVWLQDAAATNRLRVAWFVGSVPTGGRIVSGRLQLGGDVCLQT